MRSVEVTNRIRLLVRKKVSTALNGGKLSLRHVPKRTPLDRFDRQIPIWRRYVGGRSTRDYICMMALGWRNDHYNRILIP